MKLLEAENAMDSVFLAVVQFLLKFSRKVIKDGHEFGNAFSVDSEFFSGYDGVFIWIDFQVSFDI